MGTTQSGDLPRILTPDDQKKLLQQPNSRYPTGVRNRAMLVLMLHAGLKVSELLALRPDDLNLLTGDLILDQEEGPASRSLWIDDHDIEWLWDWWKIRANLSDPNPVLFTTLKGTPIRPRYVRSMVKRLARKAGVREPEEVSPQTLRHTFAVEFYRESRNLCMLKKVMGYGDLSSTVIYARLIDEQMENPLKELRGGSNTARHQSGR